MFDIQWEPMTESLLLSGINKTLGYGVQFGMLGTLIEKSAERTFIFLTPLRKNCMTRLPKNANSKSSESPNKELTNDAMIVRNYLLTIRKTSFPGSERIYQVFGG